MIEVRRNGNEYEIVWHSQYGVEVVDIAETKEEAEYLAAEYRLAFSC